MANTEELLRVFRKTVLAAFPELGGYHYPIRAKVVRVHEDGGRVDDQNHVYSVDVQPLKPDGSNDENAPEIPDVEIPVAWAGPGRGIFCLPVDGAIVRIGFYYNDPAHPFVDAILGYGFEVPEHALGSMIIQHSDGKRFEITPEGNVNITMHTHITGDLTVDGSINANGSIIDAGGNTPHHSH